MVAPKPRKPGRIFVGKGPAPNFAGEWNLDRFCTHIRGRADATTEVLIGTAVLKRLGMIQGQEAVAGTGAVWQDWKGTNEYRRAHRFPCNPTIGNRNIPDIPGSRKLKDALIEPLAVTDFLTFEVNYADCLFEDFGGVASAVEAVRYVAKEQGRGEPVSQAVIEHGVLNVALPGYQRAYELAAAELLSRVNQEDMLKMHARSAKHMDKPLSPTLNLEAIQDLVYDLSRFTMIVQPRRLMPVAVRQMADRLEALNGQTKAAGA